MEPSLEKLKARYQSLSDEELVHFANQEGFQLRAEAQQVLLEEIKARDLGQQVMGSSIPGDTENTITDALYEDVEAMMKMVSALPCPMCGSKSEPLNAADIQKAQGFILFSTTSRKIHIGCHDCLQSSLVNANFSNIVFGLLLFMPIQAYWAYSNNSKELEQVRSRVPSQSLFNWVFSKRSHIFKMQGDPKALYELVVQQNQS